MKKLFVLSLVLFAGCSNVGVKDFAGQYDCDGLTLHLNASESYDLIDSDSVVLESGEWGLISPVELQLYANRKDSLGCARVSNMYSVPVIEDSGKTKLILCRQNKSIIFSR